MTKDTKRDQIWSAALSLAFNESSLTVTSVRDRAGLDVETDRTVRDVLNTMVSEGWLSKRTKQAHRWRFGPSIKELVACETCGAARTRDALDRGGGETRRCQGCRIPSFPWPPSSGDRSG